jgi:hypothetical protein
MASSSFFFITASMAWIPRGSFSIWEIQVLIPLKKTGFRPSGRRIFDKRRHMSHLQSTPSVVCQKYARCQWFQITPIGSTQSRIKTW